MKVLLVAVNAKYIHTALGVRSLAAYVNSEDVSFMEFTINERHEDVLKKIYRYSADTVLFSCYIWNIEFIVKLADSLKKIAPDTDIIFGGPEVSFDSRSYMEKYEFIDAVISGEGEETLADFLNNGFDVYGITYRKNGVVVENKARKPVCDLNKLPFPYTEDDLEQNKNKLIYYESSRGCPFRCSYCLSSTVHNVRFKDIDKVKAELKRFINKNVRIVKFVDRTFNADRKRAAELISFLSEQKCETQFHFEIAADLINDEMIEIFRSAPRDRFLLEIGVQSTNVNTLRAIDRKADMRKIYDAVINLRGYVHMHLDLIAGLPYETYESFIKSFNDVMLLDPDVLQLGFLKLLRGTKIRRECKDYNYVFLSYPPYEVLSNEFISYPELLKLHDIENVFEKYHNSGVFKNGLRELLKHYETPFEMYEKISQYFSENGYFDVGLSQVKLYEILAEFSSDDMVKDYIKLDYFIHSHNPSTPSWAVTPFDRSLLKLRFEILTEEFIQNNLTEYSGQPTKEIIKNLWFEKFDYDVMLDGAKKEIILIFDKKYNRVIRADNV